MSQKKAGPPGWIWIVVILIVWFFYSLSTGLDSHTKEGLNNAKLFLARTKNNVANEKKRVMQEIESTPVLKEYADRENWLSDYEKIEQEIEKKEDYIKKELDPIVKDNNGDLKNIVVTGSDNILKLCREQNKALNKCGKRVKDFKNLAVALPEKVVAYTNRVKLMKSRLLKKGKFRKYYLLSVKKYGKKKEILKKDWESLKKKYGEVVENYKSFKSRAEENKPDFSVLFRIERELLNKEKAFNSVYKDLKTKLDELNSIWDRVLADMKYEKSYFIEYAVYGDSETPTRTSVHKASFNEFRAAYVNQVVSSTEWYDTCVESKWEEYKFYHKYKDVVNGNITFTKWIFVKNDFFNKHKDDLGMVLLSKPKGLFMSEPILKTAPPGYFYLDDKKCGEWIEKDGKKIWKYFPDYKRQIKALLEEEPPDLDYEEYSVFSNHIGPYYGRSGRIRWGSRGTWTNRRFRQSYFVKRGGLKTYSARQFRGKGKSFGK